MYLCNPPGYIASSLGVVIFKECLVYTILYYDNHPLFCLYRDKLKRWCHKRGGKVVTCQFLIKCQTRLGKSSNPNLTFYEEMKPVIGKIKHRQKRLKWHFMEMYAYIIIYIYTLRSDFQSQRKNAVISFLRPCLLLSLVILQAHLKKKNMVYTRMKCLFLILYGGISNLQLPFGILI